MDILKIQEQIGSNRRNVAFDSYDKTVKQVYDMLLVGMIDEYQRHFNGIHLVRETLIKSAFP
jgi:hypothetical protein